VPREQVNDLQKAIQGYQLFLKLTQDYADQIIHSTRESLAGKTSLSSKAKNKKRSRTT
jgi:hypothetical protein